jgi:O-antigen ligase
MEFLAVILGIAGVVWGAVLFKRGGLLAGCLAVLLAGACFSVEFYKIPLGALPLTADRLLLVVLVALYFVWRKFGWTDPKPLGKPEILLCIFIGVLIVSTFSSDLAAVNYQPVSWLIISYLMPFALYWIARQTKYDFGKAEREANSPTSDRRENAGLFSSPLQWLFVSLAAFGVYLSITALLEHYDVSWAIFPRYIADTALKPDAEFVGRARGPFLHPIGNGVALATCFGASLMLWPWLGRPKRLLLIPAFLLFAAALYLTLTRSVWMGGAFTLALVVGAAIPWRWRIPLAAGGLLLAVAVVISQWDQLVSFKRDKNLEADKTADSVELRPVLARIAWNMFLDRPLFGCGYGQYTKEHVYYLADRSTELNLEKGRIFIQHNVVLSLLTETGLLGAGLFLAICGFWAVDAWRLWRSTDAPLAARQMGLLMLVALGAYFINGMFHDVSLIPTMNLALFFLAGVTAGLRPEISHGSHASPQIGAPPPRMGKPSRLSER